ncbi:hypothetical protein AWB67_05303 [Caballeronia terrestris]|uniref:StbC n=1 Tax=Caballeronia terrestris TaxID=1226301 RepID=A0A158KC75_9BURK|nr:plasmid stabilization protein StbC [Caballeronia terrestris]SAL78635.1 hypothetical protein AWB67_05303 [Caballeronia terrestris]
MEPPPTKEEVLFEWFLGDSKEIVADLKSALADATSVREGIIKAKGELDATVQAATRELITAHRELTQAIRDAKAANIDAAQRVAATSKRAAAAGVHQALPALGICCGMSALIGAAIAVVLVRLFV